MHASMSSMPAWLLTLAQHGVRLLGSLAAAAPAMDSQPRDPTRAPTCSPATLQPAVQRTKSAWLLGSSPLPHHTRRGVIVCRNPGIPGCSWDCSPRARGRGRGEGSRAWISGFIYTLPSDIFAGQRASCAILHKLAVAAGFLGCRRLAGGSISSDALMHGPRRTMEHARTRQ